MKSLRWLGQKPVGVMAALTASLQPAGDAPVVTLPGHRWPLASLGILGQCTASSAPATFVISFGAAGSIK